MTSFPLPQHTNANTLPTHSNQAQKISKNIFLIANNSLYLQK